LAAREKSADVPTLDETRFRGSAVVPQSGRPNGNSAPVTDTVVFSVS
jgi:hypothetical protein